jgi:molecular chaperone DnaJ
MTTKSKDYYEVLGVKKGADSADIKKSYRRLARKFHPDVNPGDKKAEQKFKDLNEAYEILGDKKKREQYDQFGAEGFEGVHGFDGFGAGGFSGGYGSSEDIFSDLFGGFQQGIRPSAGSDMLTSLVISLEEVYSGAAKTISFRRDVSCVTCGGSGAENSQSCSNCKGAGVIRQGRGFFNMNQPCPSCGGNGRITTKVCAVCGGNGKSMKSESLNVKIPPGADTGSRLKLKGKGGAGSHGGPTGNLYIELTVRPHPVFEREKNDIYVDVPVTISEAVLGGKVEVPTLDGNVSMTLPPGTDSGKKFKLKGKGIPGKRAGIRGDEYALIKIIVPKDLTDAGKEALKEIEKAYKK